MLSEEEKEAIENLKEIINLSKEEIKNNDKNLSAILDLYDLKSLDIVLKLIIRLEKENEDIQNRKEHQELRFKKYKENIEKQHEEIYEGLVSEKEEYKKLYKKALSDVVSADKENIKLKKQIDLMAE